MFAATFVDSVMVAWPNIPGISFWSGFAISASTSIVRVLRSRLEETRVTVAAMASSLGNEGKLSEIIVATIDGSGIGFGNGNVNPHFVDLADNE